MAAAVFLALFLVFAFVCFGPWLTIIAAVVLFVALHTYFLPVVYTFDGNGVTIDKRIFCHTYPWEQFRRYFRTSGGVVLSPFSQRTFADNFRGVHLMLPSDAAPIAEYLERRLGRGQAEQA